MMNGIPDLNNKIVRMVLEGKKNKEIAKKLNLKGTRNGINFSINVPRKWFEANVRETEYAKEAVLVLKPEILQARFKEFCSMSKKMQKTAKDTLLIEESKETKRQLIAV
jgi:hypothetical protein